MMMKKQFRYEIQSNQEDCISNIIGIFDALQQNQSFCDVMGEHNTFNNDHLHI
jgi:hypothetical protein